MKKIVSFAVAAVVFALAAPAQAQSGPTITADPATVDAAGSVEVTVTGSGFTDDGFLLPCAGLEGNLNGDLSPDGSECDLGALTPYSPDGDGGWTASATFDIPAEGLVLVAGNAAQTESARVLVEVGASTAAPEAAESAPEATTLASTGSGSAVLAIAGVSTILVGFVLVRAGDRRRARIA